MKLRSLRILNQLPLYSTNNLYIIRRPKTPPTIMERTDDKTLRDVTHTKKLRTCTKKLDNLQTLRRHFFTQWLPLVPKRMSYQDIQKYETHLRTQHALATPPRPPTTPHTSN